MNEIFIRGLQVDAQVGVTDTERSDPQRLLVDVTLTPCTPFAELGDAISQTVDYDAAARRITALAESRPRCLIETLATEIAEMVVTEFPAVQAEVEIRKFILPNTEHVGVRCTRRRDAER